MNKFHINDEVYFNNPENFEWIDNITKKVHIIERTRYSHGTKEHIYGFCGFWFDEGDLMKVTKEEYPELYI